MAPEGIAIPTELLRIQVLYYNEIIRDHFFPQQVM